MIQFQGLHGVPLAAPANRALAAEIGLTAHEKSQARDVDPALITRRLSPSRLRLLHAIGKLDAPASVDAIVGQYPRNPPHRNWLTSALSDLGKLGYLRRVTGRGHTGAWQATAAGVARAAHDRDHLTDGTVLESVRIINATPPEGRRQWWPVANLDRLREPATADAVCAVLYADQEGKVDLAPIADTLTRLTLTGALDTLRVTRGGAAVSLFWARPAP